MKRCEFCGTRKTVLLNDTLYCESCEIYFTLKNGSQLIKSLPVSETKQRFLNLCASCSKTAQKFSVIRCRTFRGYFRKLPYCKGCKSLNLIFLKNLFFKNFLLYKKINRVFGLPSLIALILAFIFSPKYIILIYYYITIKAGNMSGREFFTTTFLLYHTCKYEFVKFILFVICLYKILTKWMMYFEVPINLSSSRELANFVDKLNINTSLDRKRLNGTRYSLGDI